MQESRPKSSSRVWILSAALLIVLTILAAVPPFNQLYITVLFITILSYLILTVSWVLFSGPTGYISLAPAAFFGMGMYTAAIFGKQMPFSAVIMVAAAICFRFCPLGRRGDLRLRGIYFTIFTFGLVFLIQQLLTWWEVNFTHTRGRFVVVVDNNTIYYYMLGIFVILLVTAFLIRRSKYGLALQSIGQNEDAAAHAGVNVTAIKVITFAISALFMGAAGAALAVRLTYIDPGSAFNINYSFFPVMMAIFGGMTNSLRLDCRSRGLCLSGRTANHPFSLLLYADIRHHHGGSDYILAGWAGRADPAVAERRTGENRCEYLKATKL